MKKLLIIFVLALFGISAYSLYTQSQGQPAGSEEITHSTLQIKDVTYQVEIASTDEKRAQGLSGRASLGTDQGMLFLFDQKDYYPFWMKDMLIPLDFVWIDGDKIVDLTANVPPPLANSNYIPRFQSKAPVDKVLEINAGEIAKHSFEIGDTVNITLFKPDTAN